MMPIAILSVYDKTGEQVKFLKSMDQENIKRDTRLARSRQWLDQSQSEVCSMLWLNVVIISDIWQASCLGRYSTHDP